MTMKETSVFGIGFHKTATTSLAGALHRLGYTVTGPDGVDNSNIANEARDLVFTLAEKYNACQDNPWPFFYKDLDKKYPGSKFILTRRPSEKWVKSLVRHFGKKDTPMREWIYGVGHPEGHEELYIERYETHNREVEVYFRNRPDDLLVFELTEGDGWEKLCRFPNEPVPDTPFPHQNIVDEQKQWESTPQSLLSRIKEKITGLLRP